MYHRWFSQGRKIAANEHANCRKSRAMFRFCEDFNTCVDKFVEKSFRRTLTLRVSTL
jgi:hypothetical protein